MQKIKLAVLNRMIEQRLTGAEINFILYISHYQDAAGNVLGVYYKELCEGISVSHQTFYEVMRSLEKKKFISVERNFIGDWNLKILDNDFTYPGADKEGYISTGHDIFHNKEFLALKANEKLLAMYILKIAGAGYGNYHIGVGKFYRDFTALFGVAKRAIQHYLTSLRKFFAIGIKNSLYWFTPLKKVYKDTADTDLKLYSKHLVGIGCRRNKIKEYSKEAFRDVAELVKQYPEQLGENVIKGGSLLLDAISGSTKKGRKDKRVLAPKFVHKILGEIIKGETVSIEYRAK